MWHKSKRTEDLDRIVGQLGKWIREENDKESVRRARRAYTSLIKLLDDLAEQEHQEFMTNK